MLRPLCAPRKCQSSASSRESSCSHEVIKVRCLLVQQPALLSAHNAAAGSRVRNLWFRKQDY